MSNPPPHISSQGTHWNPLSLASRALLLVAQFVSSAAIYSLFSFREEAGWPGQLGLLAIALAPQLLIFFARPDLIPFVPGPLLRAFSLLLGVIPGVVAELVAQGCGASTLLASATFAGVGAIAATAILWLVYSRQANSNDEANSTRTSDSMSADGRETD